MERVALTGATGFIGCALAKRLLTDGMSVRALVRKPDAALADEGVDLVPGALEDEASLQRLVEGADTVIHCAGAIKARSRHEFHRINAAGTAAVAATAAACRDKPRFLLISSIAAREPSLSAYAESKRHGEAELARQGADLDWLIIRPPAVYGPGDRATLSLFRQFARGLAFTPKPPNKRISLLYIDDLTDAILHLMRKKPWHGETLELDDGQPKGYDWNDLTDIAARHLGRRISRIALPRQMLWLPAATNEAVSALSGRSPMLTRGKLREFFHEDWVCRRTEDEGLADWRGKVTFDQGFPQTMTWYKDNGWL